MKKTEIRITCKDCIFYDELNHHSCSSTCKAGGVLHYSEPCENFCIDTKGLSLINNQNPEFLGFIRKVPTYLLSELAALLVQEGYNRDRDWSIGDIAYYCLGKTDYISSYVQVVFKGFVGSTDFVIIEGIHPDGKIWVGVVESKFILKSKDWSIKHAELVKSQRINDGALEKMLINYKMPVDEVLSDINYKPISINTILRQMKE